MNGVRETWDRRIQRAGQLAIADGVAFPLLAFYAALLQLQKALDLFLRRQPGWRPTGRLDHDLAAIRPGVAPLLRGVGRIGPEALATEATRLLEGSETDLDDLLLTYWAAPSDTQFFAKAILQPYAQLLAEDGISPRALPVRRGENRCPLCGGAPQVAILDMTSGPLVHGGGRSLLCAQCLTSWPFQRLRCASCGEGDERRLAYFHTALADHLGIDACDTCRRYVKSVDLTRLGLAVPIVDEVAGASLDLWAREHGYRKIELNLVGL